MIVQVLGKYMIIGYLDPQGSLYKYFWEIFQIRISTVMKHADTQIGGYFPERSLNSAGTECSTGPNSQETIIALNPKP